MAVSLTESQLVEAFKTYFDEIENCAAAKCYWALLHLVVVIPDICAALEHPTGDTTGESGPRYESWCTAYWPSKAVSPAKRWQIRCALLHQGRTVLKGGDTFSYVRPAPAGSRVHEYVEPGEPITTLDVGQLAAEVKAGFRRWAADLQKSVNAARLANVERNLPWLAREKPKKLPPELIPPGMGIDVTNSSTSSS
jgi:hypothetical protein